MSTIDFNSKKSEGLFATPGIPGLASNIDKKGVEENYGVAFDDVTKMRKSTGTPAPLFDTESPPEPVSGRGRRPAPEPSPAPSPSPVDETDGKSKADKLREEADKEMADGFTLLGFALQYRQLAASLSTSDNNDNNVQQIQNPYASSGVTVQKTMSEEEIQAREALKQAKKLEDEAQEHFDKAQELRDEADKIEKNEEKDDNKKPVYTRDALA